MTRVAGTAPAMAESTKASSRRRKWGFAQGREPAGVGAERRRERAELGALAHEGARDEERERRAETEDQAHEGVAGTPAVHVDQVRRAGSSPPAGRRGRRPRAPRSRACARGSRRSARRRGCSRGSRRSSRSRRSSCRARPCRARSGAWRAAGSADCRGREEVVERDTEGQRRAEDVGPPPPEARARAVRDVGHHRVDEGVEDAREEQRPGDETRREPDVVRVEELEVHRDDEAEQREGEVAGAVGEGRREGEPASGGWQAAASSGRGGMEGRAWGNLPGSGEVLT